MVTCEVRLPEYQNPCVVSFVYASNEAVVRRALWADIIALSSDQRVRGKSWILLGDFNQVLRPSEHYPAPSLNVNRASRELNDCLLDAALSDLTFRGCSFTWWNRRSTGAVAKKLDRVLVNDQWDLDFPSAFANFGEPSFSDHASCEVSLQHVIQRAKKPFKFFNFLLQNNDFVPMIANQWFSLNVVGSDMFRLSKKLKALKNPIRTFTKSNFSDLEKRTAEAHEEVIHAQSLLLSNPSSSLAEREIEATRKWHILVKAEEAFLQQKSRVSWLREGDSNSAYFHRMVATRTSINHIHYLQDSAGTRFDSQPEIQGHCVDYFAELLGGVVSQSLFLQEDISALLASDCSLEQNAMLISEFSSQKIKDAFFSLPRNKTCGPDGFTAEFFISCWNFIGPEVIAAVKEFFRSGKILKQWNATSLVLIPKVTNAVSTKDFRPISCLNTVYKVISKLLASRLQQVLSSVISHSQSAFMPGRLLAENVLLATEIVHGYNRRNIDPRAMLKVDLRKAFDTVRWDFVEATLKGLHLPQKFIDWILECISTPTFSVVVNGQSSGFFKSTKGLRQGDSLSPYLFVLTMEVFSRLLKSRFDSDYIVHHPRTSELKISHLMFADDVMIFFDGSSSSLHGISETLDDFSSWSGLCMNQEKTHLYHAGLDHMEAAAITSYGFPIGSFPIRYLGLPLMHRKLKISEYSPLLDKLPGRFKSWAVRSLSFAGRLQLISSVVSGTVNFWITTFMLPKGCIKKIESMCNRFLWSGAIEGPCLTKVSWSSVCLPKKEGGLGLRCFSVWNTALCLRFIWLMFSTSDSLWVAWHKFHYLQRKSFWALEENQRDSWTWKSLLRLRPLAENFIKCRVGNGRTASFWFDTWSPIGPLIKALGHDGPRNLRLPLNALVAEACDTQGWTLPSPRSDVALDLHAFLTTISVPNTSLVPDTYDWVVNGVNCRGYSSKITWDFIKPRENEKDWYKSIWFKGSTPKLSFFMWVAQLNRLPTRMRLASWGLNVPTTCCFCSTENETRDHLLLRCDFSKELWSVVHSRLGYLSFSFHSWSDLIAWMKENTDRAPCTLRKLVAQATVYTLWIERNNRIFTGVSSTPGQIFRVLDRLIKNSITARRSRNSFGNLMISWLQ
ncbi:unnamed protein product [Microthlaspi erraticum]|uniref:Reverse transcriptase domain-containing protein n=1 Tax=Microthlaspi erraticum TaxID=1685480 RepID=A0A6D2K3M1_9BRAS|nr:unnamed protein product [Microthlaspi erraticum]